MSVQDNLTQIKQSLPDNVTLVAVSKTYPAETVMEAYSAGHRVFGENKVQEMCEKFEELPKDISWHLIGHLQSNKVKYIAPFVAMIHSVDSLKLLQEIDKQAKKNARVIDCLLQVFIASEETKFGLDMQELDQLLSSDSFKQQQNIRIRGLMGMASNTSDQAQVRREFRALNAKYNELKLKYGWDQLSMGMSGDYALAIEEGSTMIRVGSLIFGKRS
jgi:pyridoxal phosphate enzyme (YggS family)